MVIDGNQLRRLREKKGFSQEKLAILCDLNKRTIQRAESGHRVALETASFMADALEVKPDQLRAPIAADGEPPEPTGWGEVVLVPTTSGRKIIDAIRRCFDASIDNEVEPTKENIENLSALSARLDSAYSNPDLPVAGNPQLSSTEILRLQADLNEDLSVLSCLGIRVLLATYTADRVVPHYDPDEGFMATRVGQRSEAVEVALIVLSDTKDGHLVRRPDDFSIPF